MADWRSIAADVAKLGLPLLGEIFGGPAGAGVGAALASHVAAKSGEPADVLAALQSGADALAKAREFELTYQERFLAIVTAAASKDIAEVNQTMRTEAAAPEDRFQRYWRPFNGYVVGLASLESVSLVSYLFYKALAHPGVDGLSLAAIVNSLPQLAMALAAILAVPGAAVGIAAWHRGVAQVEAVKGAAP